MVNANGGDLDGRKLNDKGQLDERQSEATSDDTLSDIEETQKDSSLENPREDPGPSPDGMFDEPGEIKDAGPM